MRAAEAETMLGFVKGCYRLLGSIAENLVLLGGVVERASGVSPHGARPTQAALPMNDGLPAPGEVAHRIAAAPRAWGNTVKVYEYLAGSFAGSFTLKDMIHREAEISARTKGKIGIASYSRIISTLRRAGAIYRTSRNSYIPLMPTDELREAVELVRNAKGAKHG